MPTSSCRPIRLLDLSCLYKFTHQIPNSADPHQFRSQLIWNYTVCKDRAYQGSEGPDLNYHYVEYGGSSIFLVNWDFLIALSIYTEGTTGHCSSLPINTHSETNQIYTLINQLPDGIRFFFLMKNTDFFFSFIQIRHFLQSKSTDIFLFVLKNILCVLISSNLTFWY